MINNTPFSEMHIIQQHQAKHKRRLQKILQSRPPIDQYTLNHNFANMLEIKKSNHEKWKQYKFNREKLEILQHNQRLFNRLMDISTESGPYSQSKGKFQSLQNQINKSQTESPQKSQQLHNISANDSKVSSSSSRFRSSSLHHNYQVENSKKTKIINEENQTFAQRIMKQTGYYSQKKDAQDFRKTREILSRIQRFDQMKRVMNNMKQRQLRGSSQVKFRSKTLPSNTKRTDNLNKQPQITENAQNSKEKMGPKYHFSKFIDKRYKTIQQIKEITQKGSQQINKPNRKIIQNPNLKLNKPNKIHLNKLQGNHIKHEKQIDDQADKLMKKYLHSEEEK